MSGLTVCSRRIERTFVDRAVIGHMSKSPKDRKRRAITHILMCWSRHYRKTRPGQAAKCSNAILLVLYFHVGTRRLAWEVSIEFPAWRAQGRLVAMWRNTYSKTPRAINSRPSGSASGTVKTTPNHPNQSAMFPSF